MPDNHRLVWVFGSKYLFRKNQSIFIATWSFARSIFPLRTKENSITSNLFSLQL